MEFKPWYSYKNEINLQDLSQRVRIGRDTYPFLKNNNYFFVEFRKLCDEFNLWVPLDIVIEQVQAFNSNKSFINEFGRWSLVTAKIEIAKQNELLDLDEQVLDEIGWPNLADNPGWPAFISDKSRCFNLLLPFDIPLTSKNFSYFYGLKIAFFDSDIDNVEDFLEYHLTKTFKGNIVEYSMTVNKAMNHDSVRLLSNVYQFVKNWIDLKIKFTNQSSWNNSQANGSGHVMTLSHKLNGSHASISNGLTVENKKNKYSLEEIFSSKGAVLANKFRSIAEGIFAKDKAHFCSNAAQITAFMVQNNLWTDQSGRIYSEIFNKEFKGYKYSIKSLRKTIGGSKNAKNIVVKDHITSQLSALISHILPNSN